ncbi:MAG TPA: GNAT family N-acetyltransferase [Thermomicrobiales bacterium]|nr:GNAT family N-acetyltransferase [Thermomicrobiales bacterium]
MTISFRTSLAGVTAAMLDGGFFDGWTAPPTPDDHLRILAGSDRIILAIDDESGRVVGFVTAITDGVLAAYIPLLEVLPEWRGRGIGTALMRRMLDQLAAFPDIDLACDPDLQPFYARLGLQPGVGMYVRNYRPPAPAASTEAGGGG